MKIEALVVGPLQSNCYVIYDEESLDALIVDPGDEPEKIIRRLAAGNLKVRYIVCTHGHFDHIGGLALLKGKTGGTVVLGRGDLDLYLHAREQAAAWGFDVEAPPAPDMLVDEGDRLAFGSLSFEVLFTPGHSPGGICLYGGGAVFSGDTVFAGSVGRTDLYGGSLDALRRSFSRVMSLPLDTAVFPGHGPASTVGRERESNFFMDEL